MSWPMNLGAEPHGMDTGDKRNPLLGRGGHAVSLYPPLIDAGDYEAGEIAYRPLSCGLRLRIAHSCQTNGRSVRLADTPRVRNAVESGRNTSYPVV